MKNWRTTLFGLLSACAIFEAGQTTGQLHDIALAASGLFVAIMGASAKDASNPVK